MVNLNSEQQAVIENPNPYGSQGIVYSRKYQICPEETLLEDRVFPLFPNEELHIDSLPKQNMKLIYTIPRINTKENSVNKENILYKCGWSPLEEQTFQSKITHTFVNGNLVYENECFYEFTPGQRLKFNNQ